MLRDFTLISKRGYIVKFSRNKATPVPDAILDEAMERGAAFVDDDEGFEAQADLSPAEKPLFGPERKAMLLKTCIKIRDENNPEQFTATGVPKLQVVIEAAGFSLDRKELNTIWPTVLSPAA